MKVALLLHPSRISEEMLETEISPLLRRRGIEFTWMRRVETDTYELAPGTEMIIVLGGDGTFLAGAHLAVRYDVPILGVMVGRLGFLCSVLFSDFGEALDRLLSRELPLERRGVLRALVTGPGREAEEVLAINDIVVSKGGDDKIRDFVAKHAGHLIANYRADGIILSSATGSTAYTLSAGGPLVHPSVEVMILTPICAHSLFTKPLVLPADSEVELYASREQVLDVSFDGVLHDTLQPGEHIHVTRHPKRLHMYSSTEHDFFGVLRQKFQHGYVYGGADA
jgi:NAD+ kinase